MPTRTGFGKNAKAAESAFDRGSKALPKRDEEIRSALRSLPTDDARRNFKLGMAARFYDQISKEGGELTLSQIKKFEALGMRGRLQEMFEKRADFDELMSDLKREKEIILSRERAAKIKAGWIPVIKWAAAGSAGWAGLAASRSLFN